MTKFLTVVALMFSIAVFGQRDTLALNNGWRFTIDKNQKDSTTNGLKEH